MAFLNKDAILKATDLKVTKVEVPEWNGTVGIRMLTAADRFEFFKKHQTTEGVNFMDGSVIGGFLALCLVDEEGNRLFDDADVDALMGKNADVVNRLFEEASNLNMGSPEGNSGN